MTYNPKPVISLIETKLPGDSPRRVCAPSRLSEFKVNGNIPMLRFPRRLLDSTAFLTELRMAMVLRDKDLPERARRAGREARLSTL